MSHRQTKSRSAGRRAGSPKGGLITAGVLAGVVSVPALAGPSGEQVVHGSARFDRSGNNTTITTSNRAIINYDSFNLNQHESVRFVQPGASSRVLNRIQGNAPTSIDGSVFANGNVYFVNRAGIYFGQNAVINVGGIYAAAGNITNQDFLNNVNQFTELSGSVINEGTINATREAHLVGRRVANFGRIVSPNGMVSMTAGDDVLLGQRGGKVFARISGDVSNAGAVGVENHGVIDAGSGQVLAGVGDHFALALYDTSVIRGDSVRIAGSARRTVKVSGEIDASNTQGVGGDIEILGGRIGVYGADLDASGTTGGGEIHIGGDERGLGERLRAEVTLVDGATNLSIDATESGNAGRAVVWSDGATVFRGKVSGKAPGEGGFTEVSSLGFLEFDASINLRGDRANGTLLIDPKNIIVTATNLGGATDITDVNSFAVDPGATTLIHDEVLEGWLNGGIVADIVFQANNDFIFNPFASVTQNAGTNSVRIFAGRRVVFAPNSNLVMGGGSLFALANAVNEVGFDAANRDPGMGSVILANGSNIEIQGAGQIADFTIDPGATAGSIIMVGSLTAPVLNLTANDAMSQILFVEDGNAATDQIGLGSAVTASAGSNVVFLNNAGDWSFGSLDVSGSEIIFDGNATGVTATAGSLRFDSADFNTANAGLFTFSGPTAITGNYTAGGAALFGGTLDVDGGLTANGDLTFSDAVTLTGDTTIDLASAGTIEFQSTVGATNALADDLLINLNGNGDLAFRDQIGAFGVQVGDLSVTGLGSDLSFDNFVFANSLTIAGTGGLVNLGNGDDQFNIQGSNGAGLAVQITGADVTLGGNVLAIGGGVDIAQMLTVNGDFSIGTLSNLGGISLGSVLLDASAANANLTLNTFAGAAISVADGAGESVSRDLSGANNAELNINSFGGDVAIGNVLASTGTEDIVLSLLDIEAGLGAINYTGGRYIATTMTMNGGAHNTSLDSNFGDVTGTAEVQSISFLGGDVFVNGNDTLQVRAAGVGGTVTMDGARALGADSNLELVATDRVTIGQIGDNLGGDFTSLDIVADDATLTGGIFADSVLLDPTGDFLTFGAINIGGMQIDAGEVAFLNSGAIGTLSLGSNDIANYAAYNGTTSLQGGTPLTSVQQLDLYGNISVAGDFQTSALGVNFFGPTLLLNNSSFQTAGSQVRFFGPVAGGNDVALTDTANGLISFVNTVPAPGGVEVGAASDAAPGTNGTLTISAGPTGTVTFFDVGPAAQLASLAVNSGTINYRGQRYDAATQTYTADSFNLLGDGPGTPGNAIAFSGVTPGMNVQTVSFLDQGGGMDATAQISAGVAVDAMLDGAFLSEATILGTGGTESLTVNAGSIQLDRDLGANGLASRLGSVSLTSDMITAASVFTIGDQTYTMLDNAAAGQLALNGASYRNSGASTISFTGFAGDSAMLSTGTVVSTANGGIVNLGLGSIVGNGNTFVVNTGNAGTITFAPDIQITDAAQTYFGGTMNFLGASTLTSATPNATIAFQGGTVNLGGDMLVTTAGAGAGVNFANAQIVLNGSNMLLNSTGGNGGVVLANLLSAGGETVTIRSNGATILNGVGGTGLATLDLQTNALTIAGATAADNVLINTFGLNPMDITVGDAAAGTLNLSNASLVNLAPVAGGTNSLTIGDAAYAGRILIGNATINRDVAFTSGGLVRLESGGLLGTGGLTMISMTAPELRIGGSIQSDAGAYSLSLNGPVNVFGTADIDTNGGAIVFADAINGLNTGAGFLDVNTAGGTITMREDLGVIGATNALRRLSLIGSPTLRPVGANTTGDQFFQTTGGAIRLLDGAAFTAGDNANIAFANNAVALGNAQASTGAGGSVAFQGSLDGVGDPAQIVTIATGANGVVNLAQVGGPAGLGSLDVTAGTVNLAGNLTLLQNLAIMADQTLLAGDQTMSAQAISLMTDIDSDGQAASLSLEDALTTLIEGRLGGNSPLASFTSSQVGTTTLTGGVFSNGRALFRNAVRISGDAIVQSFGDTAADGVRFLSTIDGTTAGADSLTLLTDLTGGALAGIAPNGQGIVDGNVPIIGLFGDVGGTVALGTLGLNFGVDVNGNTVDGRSFVPVNATIVLGDADAFVSNGTTTDIAVNADNLFMGLREKMVALGSLSASGTNARVGDITAVNDLAVNYDAVTVLLREAGDVFDPTTGLVAQDNGTDFVAGGTLQFGTLTAFAGPGPAPEFALPGGDPSIDNTVGFFLFKSLDTPIGDLANAGGVIVDVRADGPTNTNVAEALAGAIPQEQAAEPVVTDVQLSQVTLDALVDLGIIIKQPQENLYLIDLPEDIAGSADSTRVSRRRLEPTLVNSLVSDYDSAVKSEVMSTTEDGSEASTEEETVSVIRRDTEIKSILDDAWVAFVDQEGEDGTAADFYAFVRSDAERFGTAATEIERLRDVVRSARVLGLTEREISAVKTKMFTMMQPNMGARAFRDLIDASPAALLSVR